MTLYHKIYTFQWLIYCDRYLSLLALLLMKPLSRCLCCLLTVFGNLSFDSFGQQLLKENTVSYLREPSRKLGITEVQRSTQFRLLKNTFFSFGKDSSNHWLRFEINNKATLSKEIIVEVVQPYLDSVSFYVADNQIDILKTVEEGWKTHYENRSYPHRNFVFKSEIPLSKDAFILSEFTRNICT